MGRAPRQRSWGAPISVKRARSPVRHRPGEARGQEIRGEHEYEWGLVCLTACSRIVLLQGDIAQQAVGAIVNAAQHRRSRAAAGSTARSTGSRAGRPSSRPAGAIPRGAGYRICLPTGYRGSGRADTPRPMGDPYPVGPVVRLPREDRSGLLLELPRRGAPGRRTRSGCARPSRFPPSRQACMDTRSISPRRWRSGRSGEARTRVQEVRFVLFDRPASRRLRARPLGPRPVAPAGRAFFPASGGWPDLGTPDQASMVKLRDYPMRCAASSAAATTPSRRPSAISAGRLSLPTASTAATAIPTLVEERSPARARVVGPSRPTARAGDLETSRSETVAVFCCSRASSCWARSRGWHSCGARRGCRRSRAPP